MIDILGVQKINLSKRVLFVGEAPGGTGSEPRLPFRGGSASTRLAQLLGTTVARMHERYDFKNIFDTPQPYHWNYKIARERGEILQREMWGRTVVFVGRKVEAAFGLSGSVLGFYEVGMIFGYPDMSMTYTVIPHTSGRNRHWNENLNTLRAKTFLQQPFFKDQSATFFPGSSLW